jgi:hypothetical protein
MLAPVQTKIKMKRDPPDRPLFPRSAPDAMPILSDSWSGMLDEVESGRATCCVAAGETMFGTGGLGGGRVELGSAGWSGESGSHVE